MDDRIAERGGCFLRVPVLHQLDREEEALAADVANLRVAGLQLATIVVSFGNVYALGEAYAFGVMWSFSMKALSVLVLRYKRPGQRERDDIAGDRSGDLVVQLDPTCELTPDEVIGALDLQHDVTGCGRASASGDALRRGGGHDTFE